LNVREQVCCFLAIDVILGNHSNVQEHQRKRDAKTVHSPLMIHTLELYRKPC
jgi:hypothetical protein